MAGDIVTTVIGNLTADPELRFTPSGAAVANFTVASAPRIYDRDTDQWKDGDPLFMRCALWRAPAENLAESLTRGMRVIVTGRLKQRSYEKDGQKITVTELEVDEIGPSLRYAVAAVRKATRGSGTPAPARTATPARSDDPWGGAPAGPPAADPWAPAPTTDEPPF